MYVLTIWVNRSGTIISQLRNYRRPVTGDGFAVLLTSSRRRTNGRWNSKQMTPISRRSASKVQVGRCCKMPVISPFVVLAAIHFAYVFEMAAYNIVPIPEHVYISPGVTPHAYVDWLAGDGVTDVAAGGLSDMCHACIELVWLEISERPFRIHIRNGR